MVISLHSEVVLGLDERRPCREVRECKRHHAKSPARYDGHEQDQIVFDIPADYLFPRLSIVTEERKAMYPEEPLFTTIAPLTYLNTSQTMFCSTQGVSKDANYYDVKNIVGEGSEKASFNNYPTFDIKVDDVDYNIDLIGIKEKPTAVFDINTKLWTVAIPIDQVSIYSHLSQKQIDAAYLDEERPEKSAWLFIFRATRKIK